MKQNRATKFQPSLTLYLTGALFFTLLSSRLAWQAGNEREWVALVVAPALGLVALYLNMQLLAWLLGGPMQWAADELGLWRGRGQSMQLMFRWPELTNWEVVEDDDGTPIGWWFHLKDRRITILHHAVAKPGPERFEAEVAAVSGRRPRVNVLPKGTY